MTQRKTNTNWTPEQDAELKRLWMLGDSASQIAKAMGLVSRSAAIGRIHRLKLKREPAHNIANTLRARQTTITFAHAKRIQMSKEGTLRRTASSDPKPKGAKVKLAPVPKGEPMGPYIDIMQLRAHTCRWPIGDDVFHFCGHGVTEGSVYCRYHRKLGTYPTPPLREVA